MDGSSLAAAALYDLKNEQLQMANSGVQQLTNERSEQTPTHSNKLQETNANHQPTGSTSETHQFNNEGKKEILFYFHIKFEIVFVFFEIITEVGPEIPFEIGQFLLYKGHFLNLLHFPIWKVHTKHLLLKYDTVLADSEIAWEATDEVKLKKILKIILEKKNNNKNFLYFRECFIRMFMRITFHLNVI